MITALSLRLMSFVHLGRILTMEPTASYALLSALERERVSTFVKHVAPTTGRKMSWVWITMQEFRPRVYGYDMRCTCHRDVGERRKQISYQ